MKKQLITLVLLAFSVIIVRAQNIEVVGYQSGTWEADTVFVVGDVSIEDSLCITAGTTVLFQGYYGIKVGQGATINAFGTATDSITFTVADTTGFYVFNNGRGGWNGIWLEKAKASRFDYCRFQYGKATLDTDQDGGALRIFGCNEVEIGNSTLYCNFSREHGGALNAENSKVVMHDCDVYNNLTYSEIDTIYFMYGGALRFLKCEVDITTTDFRYNIGQSAIGGALSLDSCAVNIDRCKFEHNYGINGGGLYLIRSNDWECSITNSLFANNISGHFGGGLAISDSSPLIGNLTVANNHSIGVNCGGIFFYQNSSPVLWNCIVYGNTNESTSERPVQMWAWTYEDNAPQFHNCLVQYGFENISGNENIQTYENCLDSDPLFVDSVNEDYQLAQYSPCIDAGSPNTPIEIMEGLDLNGTTRVWWGAIDMGAYERGEFGVQENPEEKLSIRIVGNPISEASYAEIEFNKAGDVVAKVYSINGKLLVGKNLGFVHVGSNHIALGELFEPLAKGAYLLVVQGGGQTFSAKVIR
jgi:hypothetical protein